MAVLGPFMRLAGSITATQIAIAETVMFADGIYPHLKKAAEE